MRNRHVSDKVSVRARLGGKPPWLALLPVAALLAAVVVGAASILTDSGGTAASEDITPPDIFCPPNTTVEATVPGGVPASDAAIQDFLGDASASDDSGFVTITDDAPSFFVLGTTTIVTFTATDDDGNTASCAASVTVVDTTPPSITCPPNIAVEATSPSGVPASDSAIQAFLGGATATDVADPSPDITNDASLFTFFPLGPTNVGFTATDDSGNASFCTATVNVVDTIPPAITCPADAFIEATSPGGINDEGAAIQAFLGGATATDLVDLSLNLTDNAPSVFPLGSTIVTFTATDDSGNANLCTAAVFVVDTTPPTITCPADIVIPAATGVPASDPAIQAFLNGATATDLADFSPTITHNAPATFPVGTTVVTFTATDDSGNTASCSATVTIGLPVDIDIKPGSDPNSFNCGSKGVLPVAILGSADFDATEVDRTTVTLKAPLNTVHALDKSLIKDVNHDRFLDLVVYFASTEVATEIGCTDTLLTPGTVVPVTIMGSTTGGTPFIGFDDLRISMT